METNIPAWKVGDRVLHKDYGVGEVIQVDESNSSFYCLVNFPDKVKKWFPLWEDREVLGKLHT